MQSENKLVAESVCRLKHELNYRFILKINISFDKNTEKQELIGISLQIL